MSPLPRGARRDVQETEKVEGPSAAAQQPLVAAVHQRDGIMNETVRLATRRGALPLERGKRSVLGVDQGRGDVAWPRAAEPEIQRVQQQDETRAALRGQLQRARKWPRGATLKEANKPGRDFEPDFE